MTPTPLAARSGVAVRMAANLPLNRRFTLRLRLQKDFRRAEG
jgi:hypothetical protein